MNQKNMLQNYESYAEKMLEEYRVPGFSLGVARDGEVAYEKGFGLRDREKGLSLSADTVFGVGSITKSFTAMAILQLQEKGKLSVNDPVTTYLPDFKMPNDHYTEQTTIHHFLTNSSGLPPMSTLLGALKESMKQDRQYGEPNAEQEKMLDSLESIDTHADLMEVIGKDESIPIGAPGSEFSYSNEGFSLLGAIIERVSGEPYEKYVSKNILEPAGMRHSGFSYDDLGSHQDIAVLYDIQKEGDEKVIFRSDNPWDAPAMRAAGFLKSTVNDMLTYMEVFRNGGKVGNVAILSPESVEAMMTPHIQVEQGLYYGYGLMIVPDFFGYKLIQHGGDIKGVTAQMNIVPELGLTGIALANVAAVPSFRLLNAVCQGFMKEPIEAAHVNMGVVDLAPEMLTTYEGTFVSGEGAQIEFFVEDEQLHFRAAGMGEGVIKPVAKDKFSFQLMEMDQIIRFVRDEKNQIYRIAFGFRQIPKMPAEEVQANN